MKSKMTIKQTSIAFGVIVFLSFLILGGQNLQNPIGSEPPASSGKALIGGAFELIDQNGQKFSSEQLKGKKSLVFFGFTNCPSVCPTTMAVLTTALEKVEAGKVQPVFISVDPERDTPEVLKKFLASFHPSFIGLTGDEEQIERVKKAYKIYAKKAGEAAENYDVDHSALIYLMDENGEYLSHFNDSNSAEEIALAINN